MSFQELTASLKSGRMRPSRIDTCKCLPSDREACRQIRVAAGVAGPHHELSAVPLNANRGVRALASDGEAHVVGPADARFDIQLRHPGCEHRAVFEPVVRDAEVAVVADERRSKEAGVAVVASAVNAKRRAESSGPN